jgi:hypothetical protein
MTVRKYYLLFLIINLATSYMTASFAHTNPCAKSSRWDVHCAYINDTNRKIKGKWVKAIMLPRHLTIIVCMNSQTTLELERDDLEEDQVKSGTTMTWELSQCKDKTCHESQPLGTDQFTVYKNQEGYYAQPSTYGFALLSDYVSSDGESCA